MSLLAEANLPDENASLVNALVDFGDLQLAEIVSRWTELSARDRTTLVALSIALTSTN